MFKLLRTFIAVYETRSFSKAADQLFISQPTVSVHIQQLEKELNIILFHRNGRTEFTPTNNARMLYQKAAQLLDQWQTITDSLEKEQRTNIKIAASQTSATVLLPKIFSKIEHTQFNTMDIQIEMHNSEEILAGVLNHRFNFGIIEKPITHDFIVREEIAKDQLVLAGNLGSDLWLVREKGSGVYHYTQQYFKQNNLVPNHFLTISNNDIIVKMLSENFGKSIVSVQALTDNMPYQTLDSMFNRSFYVIRSAHENRTDILKWYKQVVDIARDVAE
ncbi:LysR family transcriptional regulator [Leuconostoc carnosum]|uniref:LysR family transcriptional regulator n=1 Tax=Leuconostoc TaxID=1243 RepID=UPI000D5186C3|nr:MULTISPECIES: LysR family transcriptional regulator [Leuconostoc]KAA8324501.1 LysR family transcriptional regulator [Leuconostoc carnosum]KAA8358174.1 LysR family transcriptional regulator [Leuconostoc carnosum]KAA8364672.1 LysR family transcriptional regulator [Leuconostoc carnosum]KAA8365545.1 LysR family transcriptional regulator [Leuconostoc carnosum]KAA8371574.1 LysR family transcriptional regulator [Leuconostoc carnosum]